MKKVLLISTVSSNLHAPLQKAFESLGFEVHVVDFLDQRRQLFRAHLLILFDSR